MATGALVAERAPPGAKDPPEVKDLPGAKDPPEVKDLPGAKDPLGVKDPPEARAPLGVKGLPDPPGVKARLVVRGLLPGNPAVGAAGGVAKGAALATGPLAAKQAASELLPMPGQMQHPPQLRAWLAISARLLMQRLRGPLVQVCHPVRRRAGVALGKPLGPKGLRGFLVLPTARTAKILT
jgi:hypothetical protein